MTFNLFFHGPEFFCTNSAHLLLGCFEVSTEDVTYDNHILTCPNA